MSWTNALTSFMRALVLRSEDGTPQGGLVTLDDNATYPTDVPPGTIGVGPTESPFPGVSFASAFQYIGVVPDPVNPMDPPSPAWVPLTQHLNASVLAIRFNNLADGQPETWPLTWAPAQNTAQSYRLVNIITSGTGDASTLTVANGVPGDPGVTTLAVVSTNVAAGVGVTMANATSVNLEAIVDRNNPLTVQWSAAGVGDSPDIVIMLAPVLSST